MVVTRQCMRLIGYVSSTELSEAITEARRKPGITSLSKVRFNLFGDLTTYLGPLYRLRSAAIGRRSDDLSVESHSRHCPNEHHRRLLNESRGRNFPKAGNSSLSSPAPRKSSRHYYAKRHFVSYSEAQSATKSR